MRSCRTCVLFVSLEKWGRNKSLPFVAFSKILLCSYRKDLLLTGSRDEDTSPRTSNAMIIYSISAGSLFSTAIPNPASSTSTPTYFSTKASWRARLRYERIIFPVLVLSMWGSRRPFSMVKTVFLWNMLKTVSQTFFADAASWFNPIYYWTEKVQR